MAVAENIPSLGVSQASFQQQTPWAAARRRKLLGLAAATVLAAVVALALAALNGGSANDSTELSVSGIDSFADSSTESVNGFLKGQNPTNAIQTTAGQVGQNTVAVNYLEREVHELKHDMRDFEDEYAKKVAHEAHISVRVGPPGPTGATGPSGPIGPPGRTGKTGVAGPRGRTGRRGRIGKTGATGPRGKVGAPGKEGPQGAVGATGKTGAQGPRGRSGASGAPGAPGKNGHNGHNGAPGKQGRVGPQGNRGRTGRQGAVGPQGARGRQGRRGRIGPIGPRGPRGVRGRRGLRGPVGPIGSTGKNGANGPVGPRGRTGRRGAVGPRGRRGRRGRVGSPGRTGVRGRTGRQGPRGPMGRTGPIGRTGRPGAPGRRGLRGLRGAPGRNGRHGRNGRNGRNARARGSRMVIRNMSLRRRNQWSTNRISSHPQFSYLFYYRPQASPNGHWRNIFRRGSNDRVRMPGLWLNPRNMGLHATLSTRRHWNEYCNSRVRLQLHRWAHLAIVVGHNRLRLYVNGRIACQKVIPNRFFKPTQGPLLFGAAPYRPAVGSIVQMNYLDHPVTGHVIRRHMHLYRRRLRASRRLRQLISRGIPIARPRTRVFRGLGTSKAFAYTFNIKPNNNGSGRWRSILHRSNRNDHVRRPAVWLFPRDNRLHVRVGTRRSWNDGCNTSYRLPAGRWSHVGIVTGNRYLRVYVNGVLRCHRAMSLYQILQPAGNLFVGSPWYRGNQQMSISGLRYHDWYIGRNTVRADMNAVRRYAPQPRRRTGPSSLTTLHVVNAVTGRNLPAARVVLRKGSQRISANTNGHGRIVRRLQAGNWRITVTKAGQATLSQTLTIPRNGRALFQRLASTPRLRSGMTRFVLTWGRQPRDLDSWLRTPGGCLVKYSRRRCTTNGGDARLDRDITGGHGPETVTIHRRARSGTYKYIVHQYSSRGRMHGHTQARVYSGNRSYLFIAGRHGRIRGRLWHVCNVDARTGRITQAR